MTRAIERTQQCSSMAEVRARIDALDDILVPLLVERGGYMTQAARNKRDASQVRDEGRIEFIVDRVRQRALAEGGEPDVIEAIYRSMMEAYIAYEHREFARLEAVAQERKGSGAAP
ncbi:chorismate mutase [Paracidovorax konjaci]|uniref:chorismate mutase n=1 Tax=Paracidovorax konjaci TaxID=32040 RepID=A0A1I1V3R2_9BURK|nr:chorismate mutase [Paracidovorax konjaci]SFD77677.1 isochorismate pyruvate lyase [Paracidovorax konjaci]